MKPFRNVENGAGTMAAPPRTSGAASESEYGRSVRMSDQ